MTKVYELIFGVENFWTSVWNGIMDKFGDNEAFYIVWGINIWTTGLYWGLGAIFLAMEFFKKPKQLENYKIQEGKSEINKNENIFKVSIDIERRKT
jgi:hypothetical protein